MLSAFAAIVPRTTATRAGTQNGPMTLTSRSIGLSARPMVATATPSTCSQTQPIKEPPKTATKTRRFAVATGR